jgi:hypothetical protein
VLVSSTTAAGENSKSRLKAGCSVRAVTVRPGRDNEPVVSEFGPPERYRATFSEGSPRDHCLARVAAVREHCVIVSLWLRCCQAPTPPFSSPGRRGDRRQCGTSVDDSRREVQSDVLPESTDINDGYLQHEGCPVRPLIYVYGCLRRRSLVVFTARRHVASTQHGPTRDFSYRLLLKWRRAHGAEIISGVGVIISIPYFFYPPLT